MKYAKAKPSATKSPSNTIELDRLAIRRGRQLVGPAVFVRSTYSKLAEPNGEANVNQTSDP